MKPFLTLLTATLALSGLASAADLKIYPYDGAHVLAGQRFDLRVEAGSVKGAGDATVTLDGQPVGNLVRSSAGDGKAEWTLRGTSLPSGNHTLQVTFKDDSGTSTAQAAWTADAPTTGPAKKVILFIGDGMGWNTVRAAELIAKGYNPANGMPRGRLAMEEGLGGMATVTTSSYDSFLADSANTASSIASGQKIAVNALNVYPDNTPDTLDNPRIETITEILKRTRGAGVGLVTNAYGADATPAAFGAHTFKRGDYAAIVDQYFKGAASPDVLLMGGSRDFIPQSAPGSRRKDNTDWITDSQKLGFTLATTRAELNAAKGSKLLGLFNYDNLNYYLDRAQYQDPKVLGDFKDQPYLWEMTQKAVATLDQNPNGYFLMVEGGLIDKAEHPLDWQRGVFDVLELDKAVAWAKDYARTHPDTLVLVTADHAHSISTFGGYDTTMGAGNREAVGTYQDAKFPTYGDKLDANGIPMVNTPRTLAVGFAATPDYCETFVSRSVFKDPSVSDGQGGYVPNPDICGETGAYFRIGNLPKSANQGVHTADPLPLFAFGAGAGNFMGLMDQTDIFFQIARAMGVDATKTK